MVLLLLGGCSLAGDVTPPPALATAQMAAPVATQTPPPQAVRLSPPALPADLRRGEELFAEKCAGCHGVGGLGDGELAGGLQFPPSPLGDPDFARLAAPADWYSMVTVGNLDRFMPGFASLNDEERWSVTGYALSLSVTPDQLDRGEAIYDSECAACHTGAGPGRNFGTGRLLSDRSAADLYAAISAGVGQAMPAFGQRLSESERWSLALFLQRRDLTAGVSHPEPILAPEQESASLGEIRGQITSGTPGGQVPEGMQVNLWGYDGDQQVVATSVSSDSAGRFSFPEVETAPGRLFFAGVEYAGVPFQSELAHFLPDQDTLDLSLTIYEPTTDIGQLRIDRMHLLFAFPSEGLARVLELWVLGNPTDRIMARPEGVVQVSLPEGAINLQFEDEQEAGRYLLTESGFADLSPLQPGSGVADLVFGFDLVFEGRLDFEQQLDHQVQAVIILIPPDGPRLKGEGVQDLGVQDMGGISMHNYALGSLAPGDRLSFQLSGAPGIGLGQLPVSNLALGAAVLAIAMLLAGWWWFRSAEGEGRHAREAVPAPQPESLLRAIAQLDDDYAAGVVAEADYRAQRQALKRRARQAMRSGDD